MSSKKETWRRALICENATIQEAILNMDEAAIKIVLVVDNIGKLIGSISDGDIRRGLLRGLNLESSIASVVNRNPIVVPSKMPIETVKVLMLVNKIHQIPEIDEQGIVVGLHLWDQIGDPQVRTNVMVIMAGGRGTRMMPHTIDCPKPMLLVNGKPMLEIIIERSKSNGIKNFIIAINYLGHMIEDYFGDGSKLNVRIEYIREKSPLGTAGALGLMPCFPEEALIVTNGDVLTDINYGDLLDFHVRNNAIATMAVRIYEWQHPFGVVKTRGLSITGFEEKPISRTHINAGVYVLSPEALNELKENENCDMPTLFERIRNKGYLTLAYPMHEPWMDVGNPAELKRANRLET